MYGLMLRIWLSDEQIGLHLHRRPLLYFCSVFKYSLALQPHLPTVLRPRRFLLDAAHQDVYIFLKIFYQQLSIYAIKHFK